LMERTQRSANTFKFGLAARSAGLRRNGALLEKKRRTCCRDHAAQTHWSCRKLAGQLGISKDTLQRIWGRAGLKPHRRERSMASDDPEFERKAADIIGWYLTPPQHAAVFCVHEKSAIQALDRLDPVLPMSPGRAERHGFEYYRHGTLSLYAALDVRSGRVHGKTAARHSSDEFVDFLHQLVGLCRPKQEIHVILDNLSAHKTQKIARFLQEHPNLELHFTPTFLPLRCLLPSWNL
jgi:hypothetical protein